MPNISNAKKYATLWLNSQGKETAEIAKELTLTTTQVSDIIASNVSDTTTAPITSKNLMITHTAGKKANHVAIMTKEASELNDAKLKKIQNKPNDKGIFRPKST